MSSAPLRDVTQSDADYMAQLEAFVPVLCRNAAPSGGGHPEADRSAAAALQVSSLIALSSDYHPLVIRALPPCSAFVRRAQHILHGRPCS